MTILRKLTASAVLGTGLLLTSATFAQQAAISPKSDSQTPTKTSFTQEELLTSTVHQAWEISGKNEANFFEMVRQLAELSAKNRGITLPDTEAAGRRMGNYIKTSAKADTDQLLYAVVDKAVLMTSKTPVHAAGQPR